MSDIYSKDLYDVVAAEVYEYCETTYYSDIIVTFEQSYDGIDWSLEHEILELDLESKSEYFIFRNDWNEGQGYLRNLKMIHLDEIVISGEALYAE